MKHVRLLLLLFVVATPALAFADAKKEARERIDKATTFHGEGKFKEALDELTIAYTLDPKPELLYAIGQVHVQLGNCPQAITFYQRFLSTKPAAGPAAAAKEAIDTCKTNPPPEPVKEPDPPPPPPDPTPPPIQDDPIQQPPPIKETPTAGGGKPWYKDVIGDALVGGGVVLGVLSIVFYQQMNGKYDEAEDRSKTTSYEEHQALRDDAESKRNLSLGFAAGGVVLIGAGVARYMLRDSGERRTKVTVTPTTDGGLVTWMGRF